MISNMTHFLPIVNHSCIMFVLIFDEPETKTSISFTLTYLRYLKYFCFTYDGVRMRYHIVITRNYFEKKNT